MGVKTHQIRQVLRYTYCLINFHLSGLTVVTRGCASRYWSGAGSAHLLSGPQQTPSLHVGALMQNSLAQAPYGKTRRRSNNHHCHGGGELFDTEQLKVMVFSFKSVRCLVFWIKSSLDVSLRKSLCEILVTLKGLAYTCVRQFPECFTFSLCYLLTAGGFCCFWLSFPFWKHRSI